MKCRCWCRWGSEAGDGVRELRCEKWLCLDLTNPTKSSSSLPPQRSSTAEFEKVRTITKGRYTRFLMDAIGSGVTSEVERSYLHGLLEELERVKHGPGTMVRAELRGWQPLHRLVRKERISSTFRLAARRKRRWYQWGRNLAMRGVEGTPLSE